MKKNQTEQEHTETNIQEEQRDCLRDTILTELADVLPLEEDLPEQPLKRSAPKS